MTAHVDAMATELAALIRSRQLRAAAALLRRIEFEIAWELDRQNAPQSQIVSKRHLT